MMMYQRKWGFRILSIIILLTMILPLTSFSTENTFSFDPEIVIDQSQENASYQQTIHANILVAQSFTPSMTPLTTIDFLICKQQKTELPLVISVKKTLNGPSLASTVIPAEDIPFFTHWIQADITDIDIIPGETYYIIVSTSSPSETPYRLYYDFSATTDPYPGGKLYHSLNFGSTWEQLETENDFIDATFRTYSYDSKSVLSCEGLLNWTNVQSGQDNLTGFFTVKNTGTPFSRLNWRILTWPYWGTWQFSLTNSSNLKPEDGPLTITINVIAPDSIFPSTYNGKIIIINEEDHNETCIIQAYLTTPKSKTSILTQHHFSFSNFIWRYLFGPDS
ncbi:MAG: hypothetical protein QCI00_05010 [Candidatus Thermoplasmatota archaeon]|nr:hypothetical protein [Candidatus Thermoplasmatota archaeon]